jgi:serum/glucocorticoid-regulated kinase 2
VAVICEAYCRFHKQKMAFFFKDDLSLTKYCTTKVDIKDKVSKLPKEKPQYLDADSLKNNENSKGKSEIVFCRKDEPRQISIESFLPIKVLGKGAFGKVMLCQLKGTEELYAIKSMRKENLI